METSGKFEGSGIELGASSHASAPCPVSWLNGFPENSPGYLPDDPQNLSLCGLSDPKLPLKHEDTPAETPVPPPW